DIAVAVHDAGQTTLVGRRGIGVVPGVNDRAANQWNHRWRRPAMVPGGAEHRVDRLGRGADLVAGGSEARTACGGANEVVSEARETSVYVRIHRSRITGDNGVK